MSSDLITKWRDLEDDYKNRSEHASELIFRHHWAARAVQVKVCADELEAELARGKHEN